MLLFNGIKKSKIFTQQANSKAYNAEWGVQNKGVMILQVLDKKYTSGVRYQSIYFSRTLKPVKKGSWLFVEAADAYCAVSILKGGYTVNKHLYRDREVGSYYVLDEIYSPIIFEVSEKAGYQSFEDFQEEITSNTLRQSTNSLTYASKAYANELTLYTDYSKNPEVNGVTVDFNPEYGYQSPYLNGRFGESIVTISNGDTKLVYDFEMDKAKSAIAEIPKQLALAKKQNDAIGIAKRKVKAAADAEVIARFQQQFKSDDAIITTADRGDGTAGYGSDIWMTEKDPDRAGSVFPHMMLIRAGDNCLGVVRFDLTLFEGMQIKSAKLRLYSKEREDDEIKILGMRDSEIDEYYSENVTWKTFPAFKQADAAYEQDCLRADKVVELKVFKQGQKNNWFTFSGKKLKDFIRANRNNVVAFIIQAEEGYSKGFAVNHKDGKHAPQLVLEFHK